MLSVIWPLMMHASLSLCRLNDNDQYTDNRVITMDKNNYENTSKGISSGAPNDTTNMTLNGTTKMTLNGTHLATNGTTNTSPNGISNGTPNGVPNSVSNHEVNLGFNFLYQLCCQ